MVPAFFVDYILSVRLSHQGANHSVVEDSVGDGLPAGVLGVQSLADHVEVGLLPHLLRREETELQMASGGQEAVGGVCHRGRS